MPSNNENENSVNWVKELKGLVDRWLLSALLIGMAAAAFYGLLAGANNGATGFGTMLLGMLISLSIIGGAFSLGAIAGFLFGLPRALTSGEVRELARLNNAAGDSSDSTDNAKVGGSIKAERVAAGGYGANTNLERISDWLTTIIVGIGLINIAKLPEYIENFGIRTETYFNFGGKAFGIGAGLYFLIFGFLMTYISTRTKLMLIFTENETTNKTLQTALSNAVSVAANSSPIPAVAVMVADGSGGMAGSGRFAAPQPSKEDQLVLATVSLREKQTPEQLLAVANASSRAGDYAKAKVLYEEYLRQGTLDAKVALDFASVLGTNGAATDFEHLKSLMAGANLSSEVEGAQNKYILGLRSALQANLFNGGFEQSIRNGEILMQQPSAESDAWVHLWLACAYGQKHASLSASNSADPALGYLREKAVQQIERTLQIDPTLGEYLDSLYDPTKIRHDDNDLVSLHPDKDIEKLLTAAKRSAK